MIRLFHKRFLVVVIAASLFSACVSFDKIGRDLGSGLKSQSDTIGYNLANGLANRLASAKTQQDLQHLLDSVITTAGLSTNRQVVALRDSLVKNDLTRAWLQQLVEAATGNETRMRIGALRDELLGPTTRIRVAALREELIGGVTKARLAEIRNELLGYETKYRIKDILNESVLTVLNDSTNRRLGTMVDTLLGPRTNSLVKALIDTAMLNLAYRLREDVNPSLQDNASFIKKYATQLLVTIGLIAAGIILLVWRSRQKYLKAVTLLTSQIQTIPNQTVYDDLTSKIKDNAVKSGVEPVLRKVLSENGMLGKESWETLQRKKQNSMNS
jgi:hypothetical protein